VTAIPEDADFPNPRVPFGPPARPTLRLRWGLLLELDAHDELVLVWEPGPEDLPRGYDLLRSVTAFGEAVAAMYLDWRR
jgi:hypothetical protein